jgi:hypothetical protein
VDFGELNEKAIKGLMILSKIMSRFSLYIWGTRVWGLESLDHLT